MNAINKILLVLFYIYAVAIFSSMAGLTLFGNLMLPLTLFLAFKAYQQKKFKLLPSQWALLALIPWGLFTLWINGEMSSLPDELGTFNRMLIGALGIFPVAAFVNSKHFEKHAPKILITLIICSTIAHFSGIFALYQGYNPIKLEPRVDPTRAAGLYGMAITYGYGCQFLLLFLIGLITQQDNMKNPINRDWLTLGVVATSMGFAMALARGAVIGFACGFPFIFKRLSPVMFRRAVAGFISVVALGAVVMITVPEGNRLSWKSDSNKIRISQYQAAYFGFKEKWLFGHGFRQFSDEVGRIKKEHNIAFKKFVGNSHNIYVEALVTMGVPGFILFLMFCCFGLREAMALEHHLGPTIVACWIAFLTSGLFQTTFVDAENMYFFFALYATSCYLKLREEAASQDLPAPAV